MNPKTVLPDAPETASQTSPLERLLGNRTVLFGALAVVAVILVAYVGLAVAKNAKRKADNTAWAAFYEGFEQLGAQARNDGVFFPFGSSEFHQALDGEFQVRVLNDIAQEVRDSSAEPMALYYLANSYLVARKPDQALATLDDLTSRYSNHYLVNKDASYLDVTMVDKLRSAIEREKKFLDENPRFLEGVAADGTDDSNGESGTPGDDSPGDEPPSDEAASDEADTPEDDGNE